MDDGVSLVQESVISLDVYTWGSFAVRCKERGMEMGTIRNESVRSSCSHTYELLNSMFLHTAPTLTHKTQICRPEDEVSNPVQ